jgi:hypothetical protein
MDMARPRSRNCRTYNARVNLIFAISAVKNHTKVGLNREDEVSTWGPRRNVSRSCAALKNGI